MSQSALFTSQEVRWFFPGPPDDHPALTQWFESVVPFGQAPDLPALAWRGRLDGLPDTYLVLPGAHDMGIKWREGLLQIKGRTADLGERDLGGRHRGRVEQWAKWSYAGLPETYHELLFEADSRVIRLAVRKTRAMRLLDLSSPQEIREVHPTLALERGMGVELTSLALDGREFTSLGFEAFPHDAAMPKQFTQAADRFLATLDAMTLDAARSLSYPAWLSQQTTGSYSDTVSATTTR